MSQSLSKIYLHIIFGTKNREPYIDNFICGELCSYLTTVLKNHDCAVVAINAPGIMFISYVNYQKISRFL